MNKPYIIQIENRFTEKEWQSLRLFKEIASNYSDTFDAIKKKMPGIWHASYKKNSDGTYSGKMDMPSLHDIKALLMDFRLIYLKKEPTNFNRIANILLHSNDDIFKAYISHIKKQASNSLIGNEWFIIEGKKISGEQLIRVWFNAKFFHLDEDKQADLIKQRQILSNDVAMSLLFMTIYDYGSAISSLYWSIKELEVNNMYVKIHNQFIKEYKKTHAV